MVQSKKPEIIKASLLKIFKKIESMQQQSHVHLKRFCAGIILLLLLLLLLLILLLLLSLILLLLQYYYCYHTITAIINTILLLRLWRGIFKQDSIGILSQK